MSHKFCAERQETFPDTWVDTEHEFSRHRVEKDSKEWRDVEALFNKRTNMGFCAGTLIGVERIQNKRLWARFIAYRDELLRKQTDNFYEKSLFHGTPFPETILRTGFEVSRAKNGVLGFGTYFAERSYGSDKWADLRLAQHVKKEKKEQEQKTIANEKNRVHYMLIARVLLGRTARHVAECRRKPPPGFDSVGRRLFFAVYNDAASLPEYLLSYVRRGNRKKRKNAIAGKIEQRNARPNSGNRDKQVFRSKIRIPHRWNAEMNRWYPESKKTAIPQKKKPATLIVKNDPVKQTLRPSLRRSPRLALKTK